jgi:hypothetical protein
VQEAISLNTMPACYKILRLEMMVYSIWSTKVLSGENIFFIQFFAVLGIFSLMACTSSKQIGMIMLKELAFVV